MTIAFIILNIAAGFWNLSLKNFKTAALNFCIAVILALELVFL